MKTEYEIHIEKEIKWLEDFSNQFGSQWAKDMKERYIKRLAKVIMSELEKEYEKILDSIYKLNQKAIKENDEERKSKTCYLLEIGEVK